MALPPLLDFSDIPQELYGRFQNVELDYVPRMRVVVCENAPRGLVDVLDGRAAGFPSVVLGAAALGHERVHFTLFKIFRHTQKPRRQRVFLSHWRPSVSSCTSIIRRCFSFCNRFSVTTLDFFQGGVFVSVYKNQKTGKWYCIFRVTDWTGKRKQIKKSGFARRADALEYERNYTAKEAGSLEMTFGALVDLYMADDLRVESLDFR